MDNICISWGAQDSYAPVTAPKEREVKMSARGKYAVQVVEKERVINETPFQSNFIFDWGLDQVANITWAKCFEYCRVGTVSVGSLQTSQQRNSLGQYSLQAESAQSNVYFTGLLPAPYGFSGCGSEAVSGSGVLMRRTYDFNPEVGNQIYSEIGWSPNVNGNLFSRVIATSGGLTGVTVLEGQSIRVIYEVEVFVGPSGQYSNYPITGWNSSGTMGVQMFGLSAVNQRGVSTFFDQTSGSNEPSVGTRAFISDSSASLSTIGSCVNRSSANTYQADASIFAYTAGTRNRRKRFFIPASSGVFDGYRSVGIGLSGGNAAQYNSFVHIFDSPVNKELDYILNLNFYYSWGRLT